MGSRAFCAVLVAGVETGTQLPSALSFHVVFSSQNAIEAANPTIRINVRAGKRMWADCRKPAEGQQHHGWVGATKYKPRDSRCKNWPGSRRLFFRGHIG